MQLSRITKLQLAFCHVHIICRDFARRVTGDRGTMICLSDWSCCEKIKSNQVSFIYELYINGLATSGAFLCSQFLGRFEHSRSKIINMTRCLRKKSTQYPKVESSQNQARI